MKADGNASGSRVSVWMWGGQKGEEEAWTATLLIIVLQIHVHFLRLSQTVVGQKVEYFYVKCLLYLEEGTAALFSA